jgi:hypothetical protein
MFLYFYEANFIVGHDPESTPYPWVSQAGEFDMNNPKEDDELYNGWETEENDDGTFYLVFNYKNKKYYIGNSGNMDIVEASKTDYRLFKKQKMVYDDDGTTMMYNPDKNRNIKFKLHVVENKYNKGRFDLSDSGFDNGKISNKLCLTPSNKKQYITK